MKKILSIILTICLLLTIVPIGTLTASAAVGTNNYDETEQNSTLSTAKRIYSDSTVSGSLYDTDLDYFKFVLYSTQKVTLLVQSTSSRIIACIDDSDGDVVYVGTSYYDDGYYYDSITTTLSAGTYYICLLNNARYYSTSYLFYFDYSSSSSSHTHTYSNSCDNTCNTCGATRSISHTYSNACDKSCNVCGATRSVSGHVYSNACDSSCNNCGATRTVAGHKYSNACDSTCNTCGATRTVAGHKYSNACDATCNTCGATRTVSGHSYDNACDANCNKCGYTRTPDKHKLLIYTFTNSSTYPFAFNNGVYSSINTANNSSSTAYLTASKDGSINIKYYTSTEQSYDKLIIKHNDITKVTSSGQTSWEEITINVKTGDKIYFTYSKDSSQSSGEDKVYFSLTSDVVIITDDMESTCETGIVCSICGKTVIKAKGHNYSGNCDGPCTDCGVTPDAPSHLFDNNCDDTCNRCGTTRIPDDHSYENDCDDSCNECGEIREVEPHKYNDACDSTCNVCGAKRSISHNYTNACDKSCNTCGATRTTTHKYSNNCDKTCNVCGATRTITHTYSNNCDKSCNVCGATRTVGSHKYTNSCDTACNYCNAKRTIKHKYSNSCDSSCNVCKKTRTISHKYKTTTTKATTSKNGSIVKKCTVCSKVASKTTIRYVKTFKLSATSYSYSGSVKTPSVTVKDTAGKTLKKNTDYTVAYSSGRKNVGTYKVTIKLKGKYSGTRTLSYSIKPTSTKISNIKAGKNSLKVSFTKKTAQTNGYQIQYATNKSFKSAKTITISNNKYSSYTIKNLKTKNYYVRIRTYKITGGKKYYSDWSGSKLKCTAHTHLYSNATCTKAKTCRICNITSGKALGHNKDYVNCSRCGKVLFTKLTYTGKGIKKISNIKIPKGDFILKLVATGLNEDVIDNCFVRLYDDKNYLEAHAGVTVSVPIYGWSSSEEDVFEGPMKNGTIKVEAPQDIKWTITIYPY